MSEANNKTNEMVKAWTKALGDVAHHKALLSSAQSELWNAVNALGKHLAPPDARDGEQFSIWVNGEAAGRCGDQLLTVTRHGDETYSVGFRQRGRVEPQGDVQPTGAGSGNTDAPADSRSAST